MKLWKILLAVLVCVLMLSAVAMAETHNHQYTVESSTIVRTPLADTTQHAYYTKTTYICACGDTYSVKSDEGVADCTLVDNGAWVEGKICTEASYQPQKCTYCGRNYNRIDVAAKEHTPNANWSASKSYSANCQRKAAYVYLCTECDAIAKVVEYGNLGSHDFSKAVYSVETTCTQDGVYTLVCSVCGKDSGYGTYHEKAYEHNWQVYDEKASTCTVKGWENQYCPACGATRTKDKDLAAHTWSWNDEVPATCAKDGMKAHNKCTKCGVLSVNGKDIVAAETLVLPKKSGGHIADTNKPITNYITDCGAYNNYQHAFCKVCGLEFDTPIPAKEHSFPAFKWSNRVQGAPENDEPDCDNAGAARFACETCGQWKVVTLPATEHDWWPWEYSAAADCDDAMTATHWCKICNDSETITVKEALGHTWVDVKGTQPTCTEAGKVDRKCAVCNIAEYGKTLPALGHDYSKTIEVVKPTCETQGYTVFGCVRCDATQKGAYTAALGHNYQWEVVVKPSEAGNGKNEYTCQVCDKVADTKTVKYTKYYYNNTMTSFGPTTKELVGGNDWYRVTPVDLTVDGVYTYDLIASNKYVVGTVTIAVNAGTMSVSYSVKGNVDVKDEALLIYASKADLAAGSAVTAPVGAAINVAETFGADTKVLVSLILTGDYDAAGKALVDEAAASAMIANID